MICSVVAQGVLADTITYRQLRQDQGGRTMTTAPIPAAARTNQQSQNPEGQNPSSQAQAPRALESPSPPEFVRLPDGRIVRYGPGVLCDENCVGPVAPAAFREGGPSIWWIAPPIAAAGILCAILCGGSDTASQQPAPTIPIPPPSPSPTNPVQPTPTVLPTATPPPQEIPEPGTIVLVGLGLGALLARRRKAKN